MSATSAGAAPRQRRAPRRSCDAAAARAGSHRRCRARGRTSARARCRTTSPPATGCGRCRASTNSIAAARSARSSTPWPKSPSLVPRGEVGAAGVESQHREIGEGGQARGRLPQDVRVHEPARGRQRMQRDERCDRLAIERRRQLAHEGEAVGRVQLDLFASCGQFDARTDLDAAVVLVHRAPILQQWVCQWRRAARSAASPSTPSARQATRCAVPGSTSRPQPGQR